MSRYLIVAHQTAKSRDLLNEARTLAGDNDNATPKSDWVNIGDERCGDTRKRGLELATAPRWLRSNE